MRLDDCRMIELPTVKEDRGKLTFMESGSHVPFAIERVYYMYEVPGGAMRGGHAHKEEHQFIIALSGSFDAILDDGSQTRRIHLGRPDSGLHVCPMIWLYLENFSPGSVCMVLASNRYDENDYCSDYAAFTRAGREA
jgi:hypothetical protein